jgi:hypothetical protein
MRRCIPTHARWLAAVALPVVLVTGCTGHKSPGVSALSGVSPVSSSSGQVSPAVSSELSTPSAPVISLLPTVLPSAPSPTTTAAATDLASATAVVKSYFADINAGILANDYTAVSKVFVPSCASCQQTVSSLLALKLQGSKIKGDATTVLKLAAAPGAVQGSIDVSATTSIGAGSIVTSDGRTSAKFNAIAPTTTIYTLTMQAGAWVITDSHKG